MARPIKEGLDYFPHDTDAFNDEKIEVLRFRHGAMGYMFYFFHLERIYRSPNSELLVSDAETRQIFARKLAITEQEYEQILLTCIKYHCFDAERYTKEGVLTSNGIQKRASIVIDKRNRMRHLYEEKVSASETRQKLSSNCAETIAESTQSKVKKSKEKKSKNVTTLASIEKTIFDFSTSKFVNLSSKIEKYQEKYPAVDIVAEILKMEGWLMSNPKNRKSNYERFINNWLSRCQDKAKTTQKFETIDERHKRELEETKRRLGL